MLTLVLVLLLIVVVGIAVAATVGLVRGGLPEPATDVPPPIDGPVALPADLDLARFQLAFRGYRMDQVDRVLDDARDALAARDVEIARLQRIIAGDPDDPDDPDDEATATATAGTVAGEGAGTAPAQSPVLDAGDGAFRRPDGEVPSGDAGDRSEDPAEDPAGDPAEQPARPVPDPAGAIAEPADAGRAAP